MVTALWVLYLLVCVRGMDAWKAATRYKETKCQKITVPMCRTNSSKYDQTRLPNFIGFTNQSQVNTFTRNIQMQTLIKTKCSKDLVFFLCSVLLPICISDWEGTHSEIVHPMIPPCRSVCESVYNDCIQTIRMLNVSWPGMLNCSGLPDHDEGICIAPSAFVSVAPTPAPYKLKASCSSSRSKIRRKNQDLPSSFLRRYDYVFRAEFQGKRSGPNKALEINVYSQSACTSTHLPQVTHLSLDKPSCRRKFRKNDGEVLIFAKKGKKQTAMVVERIVLKASKDKMKKALQKHKCNSRRLNFEPGM